MDEKTYVPSLTLNPTQAAAQEAPAAPQLVVEEEKPAVEPEKLDIDRLSPEEQAAVREFAKQIDVTDTNLVLSYGAAAQKNIADFSGAALGKVRTKDMGEVGDMLTSLVVELKDLDYDEAEQKKGLRGLFKKASRSMEETKAKFDKAEINVDKISSCRTTRSSSRRTLPRSTACLSSIRRISRSSRCTSSRASSACRSCAKRISPSCARRRRSPVCPRTRRP